MKMYLLKRITIPIVMWFIAFGGFSQTSQSGSSDGIRISGTISDSEGLPLTGVTIKVKGTQTGSISDIDGKYNIQVLSESSVLTFSFIGLVTQEKAVGNKKVIDLVMTENQEVLSEVVVTALGIKREKKALGYAVQDIKGDVLTEVRDPNMLNSLSGQIAGVQISNPGNGGIGGSPKIVIRGETSFTKNDPLFVIDGTPINNNKSNYKTDGMDFGGGAADINPDDVESISVLKGPTAAALYGSRAANGAIIVTTKSGKKNSGLGVTYNSNLVVQPWLLRTPNYQSAYGAGEDFQYAYVDGKGGGVNDGSGYSWGPKLNQRDPNTASGFVEIPQFASPIDPLTGKRVPTPWVSHPNFLEDFFETGTIFTNNISISNAFDKGDYRVSYTNMNQEGIMPNTDLKRNTVNLTGNYKLSNTIRVSTNASYIQNKSDNMPQVNYWDKPIMYTFTWWGMNENVKNLRNYWTPGREGVEQTNYNNSWMDNPYFVLHENTQSQSKNHIFGNISISWDIIEGLSLMGRTGTDWYNSDVRIKRAHSSRNFPFGMYTVNNQVFQERNSDFLLTWDKPMESDFQYKLSFGGNCMYRVLQETSSKAPELGIIGIYNLENSRSAPQTYEFNSEKAINSLYAMGQLSYKNLLFLDVTGRNDWSSTLPKNNNSYFYPSVSMSAVLSEVVKFDALSFLKVRGSWAQVGNDTDPYQLMGYYEYKDKWDGISAVEEPDKMLNAHLKPEKINSYEVGLDARFFQGRLGVDFAYYNTIATDQIISLALAPTSGYRSRVTNAGKIESRGFELMLTGTPVKVRDFEWNVVLNWSTNRAYLRELADGVNMYKIEGGEHAHARVGGRMGELIGWGFKHAPDGQMIYQGGLPVWEDAVKTYGNYNPDWMAGLKNTLSYKNFRLFLLLDYRKGGRIYSGTLAKGMEGGVLAESAIGDQRENGLIGAGVVEVWENGEVVGYEPNEENVGLRDWIGRYHDRSSLETNSYDASYLKLREIGLTYTIKQIKLSQNYYLRNVGLGITGRNLWMWTKAKHIDPESGGLGYENAQIPTPVSLGFNLSVSF